ncbi:hypothetical protein M5689_013668 [Euphorbia peplus]|nr:hypothetical protein M5689_013668 [Euphorbia peplus]
MELENKNGSIENIGVIRSSKKQQKQKKVPQRGLGVAQLEKIRLEEQQKKIDLKSSSPSPPLPISNNHHPISIPTYNTTIPDDIISSPNSILRLQNNIDIYNNSNINAVPLGWHQGPKVWNSSCEFNFEKENCEVVDPGLAFRLSRESNPIWPLHSLMQRSHYHQSPPTMMNVSSRSSSSSSLVNLHMELPSNQNNSYAAALWPEEELKMVGMKRSYPFSLENSTNYHCKLPTFGRSEESSSSFAIHGHTTINPNFRGPSSCDSWVSERKQTNWKKNKKLENGDFNADFLTLSPPASSQIHNSQSFDFSSLPYQGIIEDEIDEAGNGNGVQHPFYSFLPPAIIQSGQPITTCHASADFGENVIIDLNLKL